MKKKIWVALLCAILVATMMTTVGYALIEPDNYVTVTINDAYIAAHGSTYTISGTDATLIKIDTTQPVTINQIGSTPNSDFSILGYGDNVDLTIDSLNLRADYYDDVISGEFGFTSAMSFWGTGNKLTLVGDNKFESNYSDWDYGGFGPGIRVASGNELEIKGTGSLTAIGEQNAAGIGGGKDQSCGNITISGGTITAIGGTDGAGIGGGKKLYGDSGNGGNVTILGGKVFAEGGTDANDIGAGNLGESDGSLSISGDSVVFLKTNLIPTATTTTHTFHDEEVLTGASAYGVTLPVTWTEGTAYAYLNYNPIEEEESATKSGNISGTLYDASGNPLAGYQVTLHSTPVTTTTNSAGVFSFGGVSYNSHTLYLKNPAGEMLEKYALSFSQGSATGASISGNTINITYTNDTAAMHLNFQANASLNGFAFLSASFASNPTTGDNASILQNIVNWFKQLFN